MISWFVTNICLWRAQWKYGRVTAKCHKFHVACVELELDCGQMFYLTFTDDGWNFALMCRRACKYEPLLQFIPLELTSNRMLR